MDVVEVSAAAALCAFAYYNFFNTYDKEMIKKPWEKKELVDD